MTTKFPLSDYPEAATENLGKYGRMRKQYLQAHRTGLYNKPTAVWDTVRTPAGNRPDSPQTFGTDDARDGESNRSDKRTESP